MRWRLVLVMHAACLFRAEGCHLIVSLLLVSDDRKSCIPHCCHEVHAPRQASHEPETHQALQEPVEESSLLVLLQDLPSTKAGLHVPPQTRNHRDAPASCTLD